MLKQKYSVTGDRAWDLTHREPRTKHLCHPCILWSHRSVDFACNALTSSDNIIDRQRIVFCPHPTQVSDTNHHGFQSNFLKWNISSFDEVDFAPHVQELKKATNWRKVSPSIPPPMLWQYYFLVEWCFSCCGRNSAERKPGPQVARRRWCCSWYSVKTV